MFAVPFDEIAPVVGRSPAAARQLASRARRRVQGATVPDVDIRRQRKVVDAFVEAARNGDFETLVAVLDPDVVLRADGGVLRPGRSLVVRGATAVAARAGGFRRFAGNTQPALVNGAAGVVAWAPNGKPFAVLGFTVRGDKIVEMDAVVDPERLSRLDLTDLTD
jgi:hypothetical protein